MVATAESAAAIGEIVVDAGRPDGRLRIAEQISDRLRGLVRRLHADDKLEVFAARVVPSKAAFRLEKHRIDGLCFEFALEHQECRIISCEFLPDLFAIARGFRIGLPSGNRKPCPDRVPRALEESRTNPAVL